MSGYQGFAVGDRFCEAVGYIDDQCLDIGATPRHRVIEAEADARAWLATLPPGDRLIAGTRIRRLVVTELDSTGDVALAVHR